MTDKEEIIIDGVGVSKCEYVCNTAFGNICCKLPFNEEIHCCNIPNCYYKQLKRKEHECEEIKAQIETYSKMLETPEFKVALTDIRTGEREMWRNLGNKAQKYKKALDEIEKELKEDINCESQECGCDDFEECLKCTKEHILDIINKVKDGKNER